MTQIITLTKGFQTIVDDMDVLHLLLWNWHYLKGYAVRTSNKSKIFMHDVVAERMGLIGSIDHKDRDKLNNKRFNLRAATRSQNCANRGLSSNNISGYRGVSWYQRDQRWKAQIEVDRVHIHLGYFDSSINAAKAYDEAAKHYFPNHHALNFPEES